MARWYRLSLSLAAKCRIGFAIAVLLVLAIALYFPYRWMDKLVEQGKRDLAQVEVDHILEQYFIAPSQSQWVWQLSNESGVSDESELADDGLPSSALSDSSEGDAPPLSTESDSPSESGRIRTVSKRLSPRTQWILFSKPLDKETIGEILSAMNDGFLRAGIRHFYDSPRNLEYFVLRGPPPDALLTMSEPDEEPARPARYLRAIRGVPPSPSERGGEDGMPVPSPFGGPDGEPAFSKGPVMGVISVTLPSEQTDTILLFNRLFIIAAGFLAGLCAIVIFYMITQRFILQPVRHLREAADRVTIPADDESRPQHRDDGTADEREDDPWPEVTAITSRIKTGDEFERMAEAFHQMLSRLKLAQDRLKQSNRALDSKVGELEEKNIALFEADKLKSEFLANVSHELRTPLNAIIGFAELLGENSDLPPDDKRQRYIHNIQDSGRMLLSIVNNILDLAKVEAGKMELRIEKCSLSSILESLVQLMKPLSEKKQIIINLTVDSELGLVESDGGKLQQIVFNLLSNAIKFSPERGRIDLLAERKGEGDFLIRVSDNGPGIAESEREVIFDKFRQLDASITREHTGTGLGLAIVKELVQLLGGTIRIGGNTGQGAVFTVVLPIQPPSVEESAAGVGTGVAG